MNALLSCLDQHRQSLTDERLGFSPRSRYIIKTPRFRASRHVILLHVPDGATDPTLVVKVPRLPDDRWGIDREAHALQQIASRIETAGMFLQNSIPRLVGVWDCYGYPALVQTALVGRPLDPATIHRDREQCCHDAVDWLVNFHRTTSVAVEDRGAWFDEQVGLPLQILESLFGESDGERELLKLARRCLSSLRELPIPAVIEHGDFGHPNLFRLRTGQLGVIDWELADPQGIPAADLWFFLSYVATARTDPNSISEQVDSFREAFYEHGSWTQPFVDKYLREMAIPRQFIDGLFVLTWTRYLAKLAGRLGTSDTDTATHLRDEAGRTHLANWLRNSRYYAFWQQAVAWKGQ